jgi:signal transduction histidine kinase
MNLFRRLLELSRTATFRLAAVFTFVFGIGSAVLLVILNLAVSRFAEAEVRQALQHQIAIMRADVNLEGGEALASMLSEHNLKDDLSRYSYFVVTEDGKTFSSGLPPEVRRIRGFSQISVPAGAAKSTEAPRPKNVKRITVMVLTERTLDGTFMAVGRDTSSLQELHKGLNKVALWGGLGIVCLAIGAGSVLGLLFLGRLDQVNAAAARLIDSNLSERLPPIGFGSEFDTLAGNLNRMLDRLEAAITAVRQVSADVAHDLRTPLTRLRNRLEEAVVADNKDRRALLDGAIGETDEILRIFNALLRIAQVEGGDIRTGFQRLDLAQIARHVADIYHPVIEDSGRSLQIQTLTSCVIKGDAALLQQLLINLLDNAITHTHEGSVISISLSRDTDEVTLTVADNGTGIPEAEFPKVIRRFYRLDASRGTAGAGLGLPLVVAIAEAHKAKVQLGDNRPGLKVRIMFPLPKAET